MMLDKAEKSRKLAALREECQAFCVRHALYQEGTHPVFGEGPPDATVMFIGEAPGYHESMSGRPFCGAAGGVFEELLSLVHIKREDVYITNVVKLRPPDNRNPKPDEVKDFAPFLERQIDIIQPKVICSLGNYATAYVFEKFGLASHMQGISKIHGMVFPVRSLFQELHIIPLYHPAVATYNVTMKDVLKKDFLLLTEFMKDPRSTA